MLLMRPRQGCCARCCQGVLSEVWQQAWQVFGGGEGRDQHSGHPQAGAVRQCGRKACVCVLFVFV